MAGIRDMASCWTARDRYPVETFIVEHNRAAYQGRYLRNWAGTGQVYFVHNRINSIEKMNRELRTLVREASIGIAHGRMDERDLEKVMVDFTNESTTYCCVPPS